METQLQFIDKNPISPLKTIKRKIDSINSISLFVRVVEEP